MKHPWLNWIEYLTTNQAVAGSNPAGCMEISDRQKLAFVERRNFHVKYVVIA